MEGFLDVLSWIALGLGSFVLVVSAAGLSVLRPFRLQGYYNRIHASSVIDTLGAGLILLGLAFQTGFSQASLKLFFILAFLVLTGPTASHALARTAHAHGVRLPPEASEGPAGPREETPQP